MKQIIQNLKTGETIQEEIPVPIISEGQLLIQTTRSLVSLGTERMLVEFSKANLIQKARQQPERIKLVLDKIKSDGLFPTLEAVFNKLDQPLPLGYCNVGKVVGIGKGVDGFKIGDRVVSNGPHAEYVSVPKNLCALIPENVSDDEASFTVIASIALQGIRLINPTLGETIVVTGMGLIGLLTSQLLIANGCNVIGLDVDESKIQLANKWGVKTFNSTKGDVVKFVYNNTNNIGADGVIITASAKTNALISQSALMSRKRGRIVLVGVIGLELNRSEFYEKELSFQVSCSYGPGRYDEQYEQFGKDYPLPFVRWTEKRNFEAILSTISAGKLNLKDLISEIVDFEDYKKIYNNIGSTTSIANILKYKSEIDLSSKVKVFSDNNINSGQIGIIGAGNFTKMTMLPALKNAKIKYIVSKGGLSAKMLAKKFKISYSSTDFNDVLKDNEVKLVIITTRHDLHAEMIIQALKAEKDVFVEKPLALNKEQLEKIVQEYNQHDKNLTVGYNRRFSPHIQNIKKFLPVNSPKNIVATMNAGFIPSNVWIHDMLIGGGRIIGEACHFIDLLIFLTGSKVKSVLMSSLGKNPSENSDNASIILKFENGDNGIINYFSNGNKSYSKERLEIYFDEKTIIMDNFRKTKAYGIKGFSGLKTKLDKGHKLQFTELVNRSKTGGSPLIPFDEIINSAVTSFSAIESLKTGKWIDIN
ncbi:MAG: bi-domain-containing oxidoreductase [Deltaproteobacteria bacterium]